MTLLIHVDTFSGYFELAPVRIGQVLPMEVAGSPPKSATVSEAPTWHLRFFIAGAAPGATGTIKLDGVLLKSFTLPE